MDPGTRHFGKHGTIWIQLPPIPVQALIPARNTCVTGTGTDFDAGGEHFGKFGRTSTQVTNTLESSVQHQYRRRTVR